MIESIVNDALNQAIRPALPSRVLVYGAGGAGRRVADLLMAKGIKVVGFLDRKPDRTPGSQSFPVVQPSDWRKLADEKDTAVILAVHNPGHGIGGLRAELHDLGLRSVLTLVDLCNQFPDSFTDHFWLAPRDIYRACGREIAQAYDCLSDDLSRDLFVKILRFRIGGDYALLDQPEPRQYFPNSLPRWPGDLRLVDCGAYTGDSLRESMEAGYRIESAICLEPDEANFQTLSKYVHNQNLKAVCLPCAVSSTTEMLRFSSEATGSSHLGESGGVLVQAVRLDEIIPTFAPNLIKMDVEGAEPEAIRGAEQLIQRYRPGLAIAAYHQAQHLWQIPLQIAALSCGYRLYMRSHAHNSFDVVLYARPVEHYELTRNSNDLLR